MKEDYLWDRSGKPDPEIQRLERVLATFQYRPVVQDFPEIPVVEHTEHWYQRIWNLPRLHPVYAALVTILVGVLIAFAWMSSDRRPAYEVATLSGAPRVGNSRVLDSGRLRVGQWLVTDAASRARIQVGEIGEVEVEPNTRIGLLRARETEHRLSLERGTIRAFILAPPRRFIVDTPSAQAVDLGCSYTLQVGDDGMGLLSVTAGWVAFEYNGQESFVPAGARCLTRPGKGPGTPYRDDASHAFSTALEKLDFDCTTREMRSIALAEVLGDARKEDSLTLWHLLAKADDAGRESVYERLAVLLPPPAGVTREGVLKRDRRMLDLWWNQLGLGDTELWRLWERPWSAQR